MQTLGKACLDKEGKDRRACPAESAVPHRAARHREGPELAAGQSVALHGERPSPVAPGVPSMSCVISTLLRMEIVVDLEPSGDGLGHFEALNTTIRGKPAELAMGYSTSRRSWGSGPRHLV